MRSFGEFYTNVIDRNDRFGCWNRFLSHDNELRARGHDVAAGDAGSVLMKNINHMPGDGDKLNPLPRTVVPTFPPLRRTKSKSESSRCIIHSINLDQEQR